MGAGQREPCRCEPGRRYKARRLAGSSWQVLLAPIRQQVLVRAGAARRARDRAAAPHALPAALASRATGCRRDAPSFRAPRGAPRPSGAPPARKAMPSIFAAVPGLGAHAQMSVADMRDIERAGAQGIRTPVPALPAPKGPARSSACHERRLAAPAVRAASISKARIRRARATSTGASRSSRKARKSSSCRARWSVRPPSRGRRP